ncbi:Glucan 1,3-beta-glucosidase 3 [Apophysomyces sp. BC1034]|nr:Glucan 1,3-beta-glucosidase 3 [Apophysomyces sp. BC1015]KAG0182420.1 Glucan 1,3-beta-glucosidase 3 [Apophysomyces sp. BC1021]KAG0193230.1 Glucan 1,3-beta-glucosidase 3 [Apophysomyces sp. BC1034]
MVGGIQYQFLRASPERLPMSTNTSSTVKFKPFDAETAEIYRYRVQAGVNLGSVFVLERWCCPPSLSSGVSDKPWESEIDFLEACGTIEHARESLEAYWQTAIKESDFKFLASIGINSVRLPIGYWILGRDYMTGPFERFKGVYDSAWNQFLSVISMADRFKIGVLVDLHAAPGGQNKQTHCGISTKKAEVLEDANRLRTLKVLKALASALAPINNVIGLELLNEADDDSSLQVSPLQDFYKAACKEIRDASPKINLPIYIGDSWKMESYSRLIASIQDEFNFVVLDTHQYFCHNEDDHKKTAAEHTQNVKGIIKEKIQTNGATIRKNIVVGEWSVVLNSASIGEGHDEKQEMSKFGSVELKTWNDVCPGNYIWNYRSGDDNWYWSFVYCHRTGVLPNRFNNGTLPQPVVLETVSDVLRDIYKKESLQAAQIAHVEYWRTKDVNVQDMLWQYNKGFQRGYDVAVRFLESWASRVGFIDQLANDYTIKFSKEEGQSTKDSWQYDHGFIQGVMAVDQAILRKSSG